MLQKLTTFGYSLSPKFSNQQELCLTNSDYDYTLEEIERRDKIEYDRNIRDDGEEE